MSEHGNHWKGGRVVAHTGYVWVWAPDHHLASANGYAYEHRVVAEETLGRRLEPGEQVHHRNGDRQDNRPENLEVVSPAAHGERHRTRADLRRVGEPNPQVACACGCGILLPKYDARHRPRAFAHGHNRRRAQVAA